MGIGFLTFVLKRILDSQVLYASKSTQYELESNKRLYTQLTGLHGLSGLTSHAKSLALLHSHFPFFESATFDTCSEWFPSSKLASAETGTRITLNNFDWSRLNYVILTFIISCCLQTNP